MVRFVLFAGLVLGLGACEDPRLGVGASIGSDGVRVSPTISGRAGGLTVAVSP